MREKQQIQSSGKMTMPGELCDIFTLAADVFDTNKKGWSEAIYVDEDDIDSKDVRNESFLGTPYGTKVQDDNNPMGVEPNNV